MRPLYRGGCGAGGCSVSSAMRDPVTRNAPPPSLRHVPETSTRSRPLLPMNVVGVIEIEPSLQATVLAAAGCCRRQIERPTPSVASVTSTALSGSRRMTVVTTVARRRSSCWSVRSAVTRLPFTVSVPVVSRSDCPNALTNPALASIRPRTSPRSDKFTSPS